MPSLRVPQPKTTNCKILITALNRESELKLQLLKLINMGVSSQPSLVSLCLKKDLVKGGEVETKNSSLRRKVVESKKSGKSRRRRRILMKRRARFLEGSRRRAGKIERRVTTLKRLIPSGESMGLEGLFRKTADYILTLQIKVRVMQIMVKLLTGSDE